MPPRLHTAIALSCASPLRPIAARARRRPAPGSVVLIGRAEMDPYYRAVVLLEPKGPVAATAAAAAAATGRAAAAARRAGVERASRRAGTPRQPPSPPRPAISARCVCDASIFPHCPGHRPPYLAGLTTRSRPARESMRDDPAVAAEARRMLRALRPCDTDEEIEARTRERTPWRAVAGYHFECLAPQGSPPPCASGPRLSWRPASRRPVGGHSTLCVRLGEVQQRVAGASFAGLPGSRLDCWVAAHQPPIIASRYPSGLSARLPTSARSAHGSRSIRSETPPSPRAAHRPP